MNRSQASPQVQDVCSELDVLLKVDSPDAIGPHELPLLRLAADLRESSVVAADALDDLIATAIERLPSEANRRALGALFLGEERWMPLAVRGPVAGAALGITYDALRRRNKDGERRLDALLNELAESLVEIADLDELIITGGSSVGPGLREDASNRATVFLSYARADDEHEGGLVSALRDSLVSEFRFQTGQELFVFLDKTNIELGENWRRKLESQIDTTSYLLVLLTPSYLNSENCRRELERFLEREAATGRDDLVLPIYYATLSPHQQGDELAQALLARQYVDWRPLRFEPFDSKPVRMAVAGLSSSIASAMSRGVAETSDQGPESEELGFVERVSGMELSLPRLMRGVVAFSTELEGLTEEFQESGERVDRLNAAGRGGAARLIVARRLATKLDPYAGRMESIAVAIRDDLDAIERGINAMAEELGSSTEEGIEETMEELIGSIDEANAISSEASVAQVSMSQTCVDMARISSSLKPVMTRLATASQVMSELPIRLSKWSETLREAMQARR